MDEAEHCINIILSKLIIDAIDELILRTPDYWVRGKRKMKVIIADLSPVELKKIHPMLMRELIGQYLINISVYNSTRENNDRRFQYTQPGYVEGEKEKISKKPGYGLDLARTIEDIMGITLNAASKTIDTSKEDAPLTAKAIILQDRLETIASALESSLDSTPGKESERVLPEHAPLRDHIPIAAEHVPLSPSTSNLKATVKRRRSKSARGESSGQRRTAFTRPKG